MQEALKQKFPGTIKVIVVDDNSSDRTILEAGKAPNLSYGAQSVHGARKPKFLITSSKKLINNPLSY